MIKLITKEENKIVFETDMPVTLINAVRRSVNYIPILAIDNVEITKNDSALYDEIIAHRLGLIPLVNENLRLPEDCDCGKEEGCGKCATKFKLSMKGPCIAYSADLSPKESIIYKMPIAILNDEQELELVAVAKMGLGKNHAKYLPGLLYYRYAGEKQGKDDDNSFNELVETVKKDANKELLVNIESWGQIPVKKIFPEAVDALNKEIKALIKEVK